MVYIQVIIVGPPFFRGSLLVVVAGPYLRCMTARELMASTILMDDDGIGEEEE
jgi:hypothetical protein